MRMTTENILKIRDKIRKKKKLPHVQKPVTVNGRKLRTLSADIEILNGMWDNVRVGNEPGSTFGCGGVYRLACYISAASKRGSRAKPATRKAQSACGLPGEGNRGRCLCIARKEGIQMSEKEIEVYGKQVDEIKIRPYEHHAKYYETDQMGIIHHSNYIKWMEEARMDLMDQIGLSYKEMEAMEIISPVLSVSCEYHSMVHFDDVVVIEPRITKYNGIKMEVEYRMTDKVTGELRTTGTSSHCFLNRSGRPISLKRSYPEIDTKFFEYTDI